MDDLIRLMLTPDPNLPWQTTVLALLMAFVLGMSVAWIYVKTHQGLSFSRSFVQALVFGSILGAMLMLAIGNNVARGIGIVGTLAIIRFRSTMKDPRDMMFVFAALAVGIATGVRAFAVSLAGTAVFALAALLLRVTSFGTRQLFDGQVRLQLPAEPEADEALKEVMRRHCGNWVLVALRDVEQGRVLEHSYHVRLIDADRQVEFVRELEELPDARGVALFLQQATMDL